MKKAMKRLSTLVLALVLAMALAVPMFAVGNPSLSTGKQYKIYPNGTNSHLLNVYGTGVENNNVTLYTPTGGNDQRWKTVYASSNSVYTYYYVVSALSNVQALNVYHSSSSKQNCQLHSYVGNTTNNKDDSAVYFSVGSRYIKLRDWDLYLGFDSVTTNANVYWSSAHCAWGWAAQ